MSSNGKVIKLIATPVGREVFSNGSEWVNLGDRQVFTHAVTRDGQEVGFDGGTCTTVRIEEDGTYYILCYINMLLPEGTLSFQTFVAERFPPAPFYSSITGGTGAYAGARGEIHVDPSSPDAHHYTIYLIEAEDMRD